MHVKKLEKAEGEITVASLYPRLLVTGSTYIDVMTLALEQEKRKSQKLERTAAINREKKVRGSPSLLKDLWMNRN